MKVFIGLFLLSGLVFAETAQYSINVHGFGDTKHEAKQQMREHGQGVCDGIRGDKIKEKLKSNGCQKYDEWKCTGVATCYFKVWN